MADTQDGAASDARDLRYDDFDGADRAYDRIRDSDTDVAAIARSTGLREWQVARVKDRLFYSLHRLDDAYRRFDSDPEIANAWRRMEEGAPTAKDRELMEHELFESHFERLFRTDYRTAHLATNRSGRPSGLE